MKDHPLKDYVRCLNKYTKPIIPPALNIDDFYYLKEGCDLFAMRDYPSKQDFYSRLLKAAAKGRIYGKANNKFLLLTEYFADKIPAAEVQAIENWIKISAQLNNLTLNYN